MNTPLPSMSPHNAKPGTAQEARKPWSKTTFGHPMHEDATKCQGSRLLSSWATTKKHISCPHIPILHGPGVNARQKTFQFCVPARFRGPQRRVHLVWRGCTRRSGTESTAWHPPPFPWIEEQRRRYPGLPFSPQSYVLHLAEDAQEAGVVPA